MNNFLTILSGAGGFNHGVLAVRNENGTAYFVDGANSREFQKLANGDHSFPIGAGLAGWVFKNESPLYALEPGTATPPPFGGKVSLPSFKSIVCLPIIVHKKTRGVLVLADEESVDVGQDCKEFLNMAADYLSLFLETLYLRNKLAQEIAAGAKNVQS